MSLASIAFWLFLGLVAYAYAAYPALIWALARVFGRTPVPSEIADGDWPFVSLLLAAYNEAAVLENRLEGALATDYPADRFEIVVGSDGSSDETAAIARSFAGQGVRLLDFPERRGKAAVLDDAVPELRGEIVVFSDANTEVEPGAIRKLVAHLATPGVGVAVGQLVLTDPRTGRNADGLYWKYETFLKKSEARLGALLGANGAIYAIKKELFVPIPEGTIVDDFVIPLLAKARHGCAIVYEPGAIAHEETAPNLAAEFRRRTRIGAGGFQAIGLLWRLLNPRQGWIALAFLSHKVLRWLGPFFLMGMIAANLALIDQPFWRLVFLSQLAFYGATLLAFALPVWVRIPRPIRLGMMFVGMNAALLVGFWNWSSGRQRGTWKPTSRGVGVGASR